MQQDQHQSEKKISEAAGKKGKKVKKNRLTSAAPASRPTGGIRSDAENIFPKSKPIGKGASKKQGQVQPQQGLPMRPGQKYMQLYP